MFDLDGLSVCKKEVEELFWGGKLVFYWCIVGGFIDVKYFNVIKKGLLQCMEEGLLIGFYCQDICVSIYDGKMYSVDLNDMVFMLAFKYVFCIVFKEVVF